jgi:hypothetical protein
MSVVSVFAYPLANRTLAAATLELAMSTLSSNTFSSAVRWRRYVYATGRRGKNETRGGEHPLTTEPPTHA